MLRKKAEAVGKSLSLSPLKCAKSHDPAGLFYSLDCYCCDSKLFSITLGECSKRNITYPYCVYGACMSRP